MPFNGSGTFTPVYNWQTDKANGIKIRADRMDGQDEDIADGLTNCITRDGQSPATADIPFAGFKPTNVASGSARNEFLTVGQFQDNGTKYFVADGTINAYTLTPAPAITARTPGLSFFVRIPSGKTSTSATPTMAISGVFTATICYADGSQIPSGALVGDGVYELVDQGTVGLCLVNSQSSASDTYSTGTTGTVAWGSYPGARQFVYPSTAGMSMRVPTGTHGQFVMLVKQGPYDLNLYGTINGVAGTITITDRQTLPLTYSSVDGAV